jgi:hypothetical protein
MQAQRGRVAAEALMQMVDTAGGESRTAPNDAVDFVAFLQQQFREIRSVLPGDAGDERNFSHQESIATHEPMGIGIEMLGRELVELGVLERLHLMDQADRNVHALAGFQDELLDGFRLR